MFILIVIFLKLELVRNWKNDVIFELICFFLIFEENRESLNKKNFLVKKGWVPKLKLVNNVYFKEHGKIGVGYRLKNDIIFEENREFFFFKKLERKEFQKRLKI